MSERSAKRCFHPSRMLMTLLVTLNVGTSRVVCAAIHPKAEYQVKAAFLYNFTRFVEWPADKLPHANSPIVIGVLGEDPFGSALDAITEKPVDLHHIIIKRFQGFTDKMEKHPQIEEMRGCHLLFIASDQKPYVKRVIALLRHDGVLTVSELAGFIDQGGMINFEMINGKTRFEINLKSSKASNITIRSRLSRLAVRVITE